MDGRSFLSGEHDGLFQMRDQFPYRLYGCTVMSHNYHNKGSSAVTNMFWWRASAHVSGTDAGFLLAAQSICTL